MKELKLEYLGDLVGYVDPPFAVGDGGWGNRLIFPVIDGTFEGPKIKGKLKPFGADWAIIRADGCLNLDVRLVIETDDGALIHTCYGGVIDMSEEQLKRFLSGEPVEGLTIFTAPRFETGHKKYLWLNRIQAAGIGGIGVVEGKLQVKYSVYALRG